MNPPSQPPAPDGDVARRHVDLASTGPTRIVAGAVHGPTGGVGATAANPPELSADELLNWFETPSPGAGRLPATGRVAGRSDEPAVVRPLGLRDRLLERRYGVAPFVRPSARRSRHKRRHDYRRLGFVELTPEPLRLRHRILPRTVLGASLMLTSLGVGAAFAGAAFYAYYDWRTSQSEALNVAFAKGFEQTFAGAQEQLQSTRNQAIEEINGSLEPLRVWAGDANAVTELPAKVGGAVFLVRTMDTAGRPSVGTAFVVASNGNESLLVTSFDTVAALTAKPGPPLTVEKGNDSFAAELWAWDSDHDLALLKTTRGNLPKLEWAPESERAEAVGARVYAIAGIGGQGATVARGLAIDASQAGIRHDTPLGPEFRGAPLTNAKGQVLGVASTSYSPTGIEPGALTFAPFVTTACERLLRCPASLTAPAAPSGKNTATTR